MARRPLPPSLRGSADDIASAYYDALHSGDLERLMACWAEDDEVVCIHPGGPRLLGLGAIRAAYEQLFSHGTLRVDCEAVHKAETLDSAVHSLRERVEVITHEGPIEAFVMVTNVYHRTPQGWRMVCHHASPGGTREPADVAEKPPILH